MASPIQDKTTPFSAYGQSGDIADLISAATGNETGSTSQGIDKLTGVGAATAGGLGLVQMAVGLNQLKKAKRLPFPSYREAARPLETLEDIYARQYQMGIGSEMEGIMRSNAATQFSQAMRNVSERSPQASQFVSRTAGLSGLQAEQGIVQADIQAKQQALTGLERIRAGLTSLGLKDISEQRAYKILAQKAAGGAIETATENLAKSAMILGGAKEVA